LACDIVCDGLLELALIGQRRAHWRSKQPAAKQDRQRDADDR
jgi:hypothetical protein